MVHNLAFNIFLKNSAFINHDHSLYIIYIHYTLKSRSYQPVATIETLFFVSILLLEPMAQHFCHNILLTYKEALQWMEMHHFCTLPIQCTVEKTQNDALPVKGCCKCIKLDTYTRQPFSAILILHGKFWKLGRCFVKGFLWDRHCSL